MKRKKVLGLPIGPPEPTLVERWGRAAAVGMGAAAVAVGGVQAVRMRIGANSRGSSEDPRSVRAELQHRLKAGEIDLPTALTTADHDEAVGRTRVKVLLQNLPGVGPAGARRAMEELGIDEHRRVRGLGTRQREKLLSRFPSTGAGDREEPASRNGGERSRHAALAR